MNEVLAGFGRLMAVCVLLLGLCGAAAAQSVTGESVAFPRNKTSVGLSHRLRGDDQWLYVVSGDKGQTLRIDMQSNNRAAYFNVSGTGSVGMLHLGAISGNSFEVVLPAADDYQVLVYLTHDAAIRDERAINEITFQLITPPPPKPRVTPPAWEVHGLKSGERLPVRVVPLLAGPAVATVRNGDIVTNLRCLGKGVEKWCEVRLKTPQVTGWINAAHLRVPKPAVIRLPEGNGEEFDDAGTLPCNAGAAKTECGYGVIYGRNRGSARLWVAIGRDGQRMIHFQYGVPIYSDGPGPLDFDLKGRTLIIRIGRETYEVIEPIILPRL
jgi:hypothetical protein